MGMEKCRTRRTAAYHVECAETPSLMRWNYVPLVCTKRTGVRLQRRAAPQGSLQSGHDGHQPTTPTVERIGPATLPLYSQPKFEVRNEFTSRASPPPGSAGVPRSASARVSAQVPTAAQKRARTSAPAVHPPIPRTDGRHMTTLLHRLDKLPATGW